jgi:hypothetical protein
MIPHTASRNASMHSRLLASVPGPWAGRFYARWRLEGNPQTSMPHNLCALVVSTMLGPLLRPNRRADPAGPGLELSLILSLIHLRTPASIGVHPMPLSRQTDLHGQSWTVVLNPEKRKVGGSTPPLTTPCEQRKRCC